MITPVSAPVRLRTIRRVGRSAALGIRSLLLLSSIDPADSSDWNLTLQANLQLHASGLIRRCQAGFTPIVSFVVVGRVVPGLRCSEHPESAMQSILLRAPTEPQAWPQVPGAVAAIQAREGSSENFQPERASRTARVLAAAGFGGGELECQLPEGCGATSSSIGPVFSLISGRRFGQELARLYRLRTARWGFQERGGQGNHHTHLKARTGTPAAVALSRKALQEVAVMRASAE